MSSTNIDVNEMLVELYRMKIDVRKISYFGGAAIVNSWLLYFMTFYKKLL
uniref:Uncharacterized protein n=1 Tax=Lepeophtheirus salmonis TaxID=72036 RepID=A0A0K2UKY6_LEPSM